jgi:hypothetical protein
MAGLVNMELQKLQLKNREISKTSQRHRKNGNFQIPKFELKWFGNDSASGGKIMARSLAYCGLDCSACNAYIATQKNDLAMIERTAREWSEMYHSEIAAKDVWCDGCTAQTGRFCGHCSDCYIRTCSQEHQVVNCGTCPEYGCETIKTFIEMAPDVKITLDRIHTGKNRF